MDMTKPPLSQAIFFLPRKWLMENFESLSTILQHRSMPLCIPLFLCYSEITFLKAFSCPKGCAFPYIEDNMLLYNYEELIMRSFFKRSEKVCVKCSIGLCIGVWKKNILYKTTVSLWCFYWVLLLLHIIKVVPFWKKMH